jgi:sialate O-acetylesterase
MSIKQRTSFFILSAILLLNTALYAQIKVACIGNSVTYGYGLENRESECYPVQLQGLLGDKYNVRNFGHSGATLLKQGHNPYYKTVEFSNAIAFAPDIAIIHLGLNDTDPRDWPDYGQNFEADYSWLIDAFRKANPKVKIYIALLSPIFSGHPRFKSGTRDWYWQIQSLIPAIAKANNTGLVDFHTPLYNRPDLFPDNLHPTKEGATILAQTCFQRITGNYGGLKLPAVFTDNMVLQRNHAITIYGIANAGDIVIVTFKDQQLQTKTNEYGQWKVNFPQAKAGGPYKLRIADKDSTVKLKNIFIGDVWLCAGQSNMFFPLKKSTGGTEEINKSASTKNLHLYKLNLQAETDPIVWDSVTLQKANQLKFFSGSWKTCDSLSAADFSAVAYYFGKKVADKVQVPIGLIEVAVGGSPTESWIDRYTMESDDLLVDMVTNWRKSDFVMQWCRDRADINLKNAKSPIQRHTYEPCYNYEAAIAPLTQFAIKGVVWYQGESNTQNIELHEHLFKTLVSSWRKKWTYNFPFYYVQLSGINRPSWPAFRDSQRKLQLQIPNTQMAVSYDVGDSLNVHYTNKRPVGERLANLALHYTYNENIRANGPEPINARKSGNKIIISFADAGQLKTAHQKPLNGFELINDKGNHITPTMSFAGNKIVLIIPAGENIQTINYAMQPFTRANLINEAGLPASTFTMKFHNNNLFY